MKKDYTHIVFVLDRSGSMVSCWDDVVGGFNTLMQDQKKLEKPCTFSLFAFDTIVEKPISMANIKEVPEFNELNIRPRNMTALYDAIGKAINETGETLSALEENERPESVLVFIQTDGYENSSEEFTQTALKEMIDHQTEKYNWDFMFLGADIQSTKAAMDMGIKADRVSTYTTTNTVDQYAIMSEKLFSYRDSNAESRGVAISYSEEDRKILNKQ